MSLLLVCLGCIDGCPYSEVSRCTLPQPTLAVFACRVLIQVDSAWLNGDHDGARRLSNSARMWNIVGIVLGVILYVVIVIAVVAANAAAY